MMPVNPSLVDSLREAGVQVFANHPVVFAYLFGSTALGRNRPGSDVDIAVYLDPATSEDRFLSLSLELAQEMSDASGLGSIEVTILNEAPLLLRGRAISERITIYSRDESFRVRFESATLREFFDFQIHAKVIDEKFLRDTAEGRR